MTSIDLKRAPQRPCSDAKPPKNPPPQHDCSSGIYLVHRSQPQRRHLLVLCCLQAELLAVLRAHWFVVKNHTAGP